MKEKEKEKSKGHPFAGFLHPAEEIVWMSDPVVSRLRLIDNLYNLLVGDRPVEYAYAITNERLLYRHKTYVAAISLERLPSISLFPGSGKRGTLSFGAVFPMWSNLDDAIRVKTIIEQAQKHRLEGEHT